MFLKNKVLVYSILNYNPWFLGILEGNNVEKELYYFFLVFTTWQYLYSRDKVKVKGAQSCPTLCDPMDYTGQNTGVGSFSLLQGIFPTQGSNPGLPHCRRILYQLSYQGSPILEMKLSCKLQKQYLHEPWRHQL